MNNVNISFFQSSFNQAKTYIFSKGSEWKGRIIVKIKENLTHLEDRRVAIATIFVANFVILELAMRISQLVGLCLPDRTMTQKRIKKVIEITIASVLTLSGNVAFVKATALSLNSFIITAVMMVAFITKYHLTNYVEH